MQINIAIRHGHLSDNTQAKMQSKIAKLTRFHERLVSAEVTVDLQKEERPTIEICVTAEKAGQFVAKETTSKVMTACEAVISKLEQQLKKHKEKITERHRQGGGRRAELEAESSEEEEEEEEFATEDVD